MASLNRVLLIGNLTRDPEVRYTPSGQAVGRLGMAVNRKYTNAKNELVEEVTFVDVDVWGKQAEACRDYIRKGNPIFVEGRLKLDSWEDRETGKNMSKLRVVAERVQFLGSPARGAQYPEGPGADDAGGDPAGHEPAPPRAAPAPRPPSRPAPPPMQAPRPAPRPPPPPPSDAADGDAGSAPPPPKRDPGPFHVEDESVDDIPF